MPAVHPNQRKVAFVAAIFFSHNYHLEKLTVSAYIKERYENVCNKSKCPAFTGKELNPTLVYTIPVKYGQYNVTIIEFLTEGFVFARRDFRALTAGFAEYRKELFSDFRRTDCIQK